MRMASLRKVTTFFLSQQVIKLFPGLLDLTVHSPLPQCSPSLSCNGCAVDVSTGARHPMIDCSLHFDQLWFSIMLFLCCKEFPWWIEELHLSVNIKISKLMMSLAQESWGRFSSNRQYFLLVEWALRPIIQPLFSNMICVPLLHYVQNYVHYYDSWCPHTFFELKHYISWVVLVIECWPTLSKFTELDHNVVILCV